MEHCFLHPLPLVQADLLISSETGWDILKPGQKSSPATAYKETITKNNCSTYVQLGQLWNNNTKSHKPTAISEVHEQSRAQCPLHTVPPREREQTAWDSPPAWHCSTLPSLPALLGQQPREPFLVSAPSQVPTKLCLNSSLLASYQLILIKESKDSSQ